MKRLLIFAVLISAVTLAGFWTAPKICMMMWPGSVHPSQSWYFALGLNVAQEKALKEAEASFREETDKLCMQICSQRLELLNLMRDPKVSQDAVYQKIEQIGRLQITLEKEIATHILQVKKNLTPAQSEVYLGRIRQELAESIRQSGFGEVLT